jgi:hypothetical protein
MRLYIRDLLDRCDGAEKAPRSVAQAAPSPPASAPAILRRPPRNEQLRRARLVRISPTGSGRPMSRQELAELINRELSRLDPRHTVLDATYIGKLERGEIRWPQAAYRAAFRSVLAAPRDRDLGFYIVRGTGVTTFRRQSQRTRSAT